MIKFILSTILLLFNHLPIFLCMQTLIINQSQNYLINFNCLTNQNEFKLIMRGRFYLDIIHADHANLIMRYLSIQWSNLETKHTIVTIRISRSFFMICNEWIDACNATMTFGVHGYSFQSSFLIKSCVQNQVSIECPSLTELGKRMSM